MEEVDEQTAADLQQQVLDDLLQHPALFEFDPDAAMRARARWRKAMPMLAREDDGKLGDKAGKQVVDYLRTQSEKKKGVSGAEAALKLGKRTAKVADQRVELGEPTSATKSIPSPPPSASAPEADAPAKQPASPMMEA